MGAATWTACIPRGRTITAWHASSATCLGTTFTTSAILSARGGSIHTDGEGTALVTEACLLSAGRNPDLTKAEIERALCDYLGVSKVIWLPRGIYNDETNEHVDNVCAFTAPGEVVLAWTDDEDDPQYALSAASLAVLETELDAKGRRIKVHRLPLPKPVTITAEECEGLDLCEGEPTRTPGERLAASYVNFYIANHAVVMPAFGDPADERAQEILPEAVPDARDRRHPGARYSHRRRQYSLHHAADPEKVRSR